MAKKNVGTLIKEARTAAGLTQAGLAAKVTGCTAADIGKAERGEKELTQSQLKEIARATGVTQKSLLEAASGGTGTAAAKPAASSSAKKPASTSKVEVTAAEKKLLEYYRAADAATKKAAVAVLKGETTAGKDVLNTILNSVGSLGASDSASTSDASGASGAANVEGILNSILGNLKK